LWYFHIYIYIYIYVCVCVYVYIITWIGSSPLSFLPWSSSYCDFNRFQNSIFILV
jgi:hypothetical protein